MHSVFELYMYVMYSERILACIMPYGFSLRLLVFGENTICIMAYAFIVLDLLFSENIYMQNAT